MSIQVTTKHGTRRLERVRPEAEADDPEFAPEVQARSTGAPVALGIAGYLGAVALGCLVLVGAIALM